MEFIKHHHKSLDSHTNLIISGAGFNPNFVKPRPIGIGAHHFVYHYVSPEPDQKVIKIPHRRILSPPLTEEDEKRYNNLVAQYLPAFYVPTTVINTPAGYCIVSKYIEGRSLSTRDFQNNDILEQFMRLIKGTQQLFLEHGMMIDFIGLSGAVDFFNSKSILDNKPIGFSNILLPNDNNLRLVGHNLIPLKDPQTYVERVKYASVFLFNQFVIKHYCGIDIAGNKAIIKQRQSY